MSKFLSVPLRAAATPPPPCIIHSIQQFQVHRSMYEPLHEEQLLHREELDDCEFSNQESRIAVL